MRIKNRNRREDRRKVRTGRKKERRERNLRIKVA